MSTPKKEVCQLTPKETEAQECFAKLRDEILNLNDGLEVNEILSIIDDCAPTWAWLTVDEVAAAAAADASDRPGCPRELPTAEEVRTWLDEDPGVQKPVFLAGPDTPSDDFLAYPAYEVPDIILAALRRWGCDPQFSAEEVALHAAPWSLLGPPSGFPKEWHKDSLVVRNALDSISVYKKSSPSTPIRDELNEAPPPAPAGSSITNGLEKVQEGESAPIPVSEQMPEPGIKVIAHYLNDLGKGRTIMAEWVPAKSRKDDNDEDFVEHDEDEEESYWAEGWYEVVENLSDYCALLVDNKVTHWRSLPASPYQDKN
jgi:hypothetical protein